jgi:hypothetical protein
MSRAGIAWPLPSPSTAPDSLAGIDFAAVLAAAAEVEEIHERWHANIGPLFAGPVYSSKPRKRKTPNSAPEGVSPDQQQQREEEPSCASKLRLTPALRDIQPQIGGLDLESSLGYYLY